MKNIKQFVKEHDDEEERRTKILDSHVLDGKQIILKDIKEFVKKRLEYHGSGSKSIPDEKHSLDGIEVTVKELDEYLKYEKYNLWIFLYMIIGLATVGSIFVIGGPFFISNPMIQFIVATLSFGTFLVLFIFLIAKQSLKWHKQTIGAKEVFYRFDKKAE